jgi:hypothetical protein
MSEFIDEPINRLAYVRLAFRMRVHAAAIVGRHYSKDTGDENETKYIEDYYRRNGDMG